MSQPRTVLTSSQVAEKLGKSKRTIQRMADKGELEAFGKLPGPNGAYLFDLEVVEDYLRPAGNGLVQRGFAEPSADVLARAAAR